MARAERGKLSRSKRNKERYIGRWRGKGMEYEGVDCKQVEEKEGSEVEEVTAKGEDKREYGKRGRKETE